MARLVMKTLSASTTTKKTIQRGLGRHHGRPASVGGEPRGAGGGVAGARLSGWFATALFYTLSRLAGDQANRLLAIERSDRADPDQEARSDRRSAAKSGLRFKQSRRIPDVRDSRSSGRAHDVRTRPPC